MASLDMGTLKQLLEKLTIGEPTIRGVAIVSPDGLILVSSITERDENDRLAAMTSEMLTAGNMTVRELNAGPLYMNMVFGTEGGVIVRGIDEEMVLAALINRSANVGRVVGLINQTVSALRAS